ncbi:MAG: hypothetical protein QFE16_01515 [Pseudomonadota bacterium]|nr:hypothetical protein [Pseudomonadota bacterium]
MQPSQSIRNPFSLMINPEAVLMALERSDALARLQTQVFRPLDKPLLSSKTPDDVAAYDRRIDQGRSS